MPKTHGLVPFWRPAKRSNGHRDRVRRYSAHQVSCDSGLKTSAASRLRSFQLQNVNDGFGYTLAARVQTGRRSGKEKPGTEHGCRSIGCFRALLTVPNKMSNGFMERHATFTNGIEGVVKAWRSDHGVVTGAKNDARKGGCQIPHTLLQLKDREYFGINGPQMASSSSPRGIDLSSSTVQFRLRRRVGTLPGSSLGGSARWRSTK